MKPTASPAAIKSKWTSASGRRSEWPLVRGRLAAHLLSRAASRKPCGAPPRGRAAGPVDRLRAALRKGRREAGQGASRGPGGPPHKPAIFSRRCASWQFYHARREWYPNSRSAGGLPMRVAVLLLLLTQPAAFLVSQTLVSAP